MVQAGVFRNVAIDGTHPCSKSGESTMPVQNMACVWAKYSACTTRQLINRLSR